MIQRNRPVNRPKSSRRSEIRRARRVRSTNGSWCAGRSKAKGRRPNFSNVLRYLDPLCYMARPATAVQKQFLVERTECEARLRETGREGEEAKPDSIYVYNTSQNKVDVLSY